MSRVPKSCPICRDSFEQLPTHMQLEHQLHGSKYDKVMKLDSRRHLKSDESSHDIDNLKTYFPNDYLRVAFYLVCLRQPVFERVNCKAYHPVRHLSISDIKQAIDKEEALRKKARNDVNLNRDCLPVCNRTATAGEQESRGQGENRKDKATMTLPFSSCSSEPSVPRSSKPGSSDSATKSNRDNECRTVSSGVSVEMTNPQKMKTIVAKCVITADGDLPRAADFRKVMRSDRALTIQTNSKQIKSMAGFASEKRHKLRAEVILQELGCSLYQPGIERRIEERLQQRNWFTKKSYKTVLSKCKKAIANK